MTGASFMRMQKLSGKAIIAVAARHNCREILAELGGTPGCAIDPARTPLNRVLRGASTAAGVADEARALMAAAGVKALRKDAVRALEIIFSLPPGSPVDQDSFFADAVQWVELALGAPVISAIVHNDEAAPHCHVILLPLVDGRMVGSDLMGNRAKLQTLQSDFQMKVGQRYGLARQAAPARASAAQRRQAIDSAFDVLEANSGLQAALLRILLEPHRNNPTPLLQALGIDMPAPKGKSKSFAAIMTAPCKPIGFERRNPIGFADFDAAENEQTLSCVGFAHSTAPNPPDFQCQQATTDTAKSASTTDHQQAADQVRADAADSGSIAHASPASDEIRMKTSAQPSAANVQQASSGPAAQQLRPVCSIDDDHGTNPAPARDQQQERSTAGGFLSFQDTPLVVSTNPADQAASTSAPRKRATAKLQAKTASASPAAAKRVKAAPAKPASKRAGPPASTATSTALANTLAGKLPLVGELCQRTEAPSTDTAPVTAPNTTSQAARRRTADGTADQPDEIRTLGNTGQANSALASSSSGSASLERTAMLGANVATLGEPHQDVTEAAPISASDCTAPVSASVGGRLLLARQTTTEPEEHPAPSHGPDERATARLMAPAPDAEHDRHRQPVTPEHVPDLHPLEGEQRQADADGDYQREREQDWPAETWDVDRGEFITAPASIPGRRAAAHRGWGADAQGNAPSMLQALLDERPSPADIALASIRAVHGWH